MTRSTQPYRVYARLTQPTPPDAISEAAKLCARIFAATEQAGDAAAVELLALAADVIAARAALLARR